MFVVLLTNKWLQKALIPSLPKKSTLWNVYFGPKNYNAKDIATNKNFIIWDLDTFGFLKELKVFATQSYWIKTETTLLQKKRRHKSPKMTILDKIK